jgi:hypothetical protein
MLTKGFAVASADDPGPNWSGLGFAAGLMLACILLPRIVDLLSRWSKRP